MQVAVVGSGVMGLCCAWRLTQHRQPGISVTLFSDPVKSPASLCAGGMLAPWSESDTLPAQLQTLSLQLSLPFWRQLSARLGTFYRDRATLILAHRLDESLLKRFTRSLPEKTYTALDAAAIAAAEPVLGGRFQRGLSVRDEAFLDPLQILEALSGHLRQHHTVIEAAVEPLQLKTSFDTVIDCRGSYSGLQGLRSIKGERLLLHCPELQISHCIRMMHPRYPIYIVPHADDRYMVGATMIEDNTDNRVSARSAMELLSAFSSLHPVALEGTLIAIDAGFRPAFRDQLPRVVRSCEEPSVIACNGLYRHGFLLAPVLATVVEKLLTGQIIEETFKGFLAEENHNETVY